MDNATLNGTINKTIRNHEETIDWDLKEEAKDLYVWFDRFNEEFFNNKLEQCVISFERTRLNNLGHYVTELNGLGLPDNINLNLRHIKTRPKFATLATLLHEMVHQWQRRLGSFSDEDTRKTKHNYHNKEFIEMTDGFGLKHNKKGHRIAPPFGRFVEFLKKFNIDITEEPPLCTGGGVSKLIKYSCECVPAINIRVAVSHFSATCNTCKTEFKKA